MLDVALKEWAVVCDLLLEGKLAILLRKGGIHEAAGPGVFELEYSRFLLFPSWAHQKAQMLKEPYRARVQELSEPATITFRGLGEVARVWQVKDRSRFDLLDDLHCWTPAHVDLRFSYKPERPLYLVAVRAYRLQQPKTVANNPEYAGCKSWVPLRPGDAVDDRGASPVMTQVEFDRLLSCIDRAMS